MTYCEICQGLPALTATYTDPKTKKTTTKKLCANCCHKFGTLWGR